MSFAGRNENGRMALPRAVATVTRGLVASLYDHWHVALFSLVAAFAIWFFIQDVENPRVQASFPAEGQPASIPVKAVDTDRLIPNEQYHVAVDVEGREADLAGLSEGDFEATIDVNNIPVNVPTEVPVRVSSTRSGVKVLAVHPPTILVTVEPLIERDVEVRLNPSGQLAPGLRIEDSKIEPLSVKLSGLQDRIDNVASVDLDVNLGALREGSTVIEGELRARNAAGIEVLVTIAPDRAKVTYTVQQTFVQRSVPVAATTTGQVAAGYRITNIVIEPPVISVSGPADRIASLAELRTEPIPLTNATGEIRVTRNIDVKEENLSLERRQVSVRIEVKPIECAGAAASSPCGAVTIQVAPSLTGQPEGLIVTHSVRVSVQLIGPLLELDRLTPASVQAVISLIGAGQGTALYPVSVTVPQSLLNLGIRAEPIAPIPITLGPGP